MSYQKESLSRVFKSDFLMFSTTYSILIFLTQILELSIAISTYGDLCCERILGDQSVVITKVPSLHLRRRTCGFAVFQIRVELGV